MSGLVVQNITQRTTKEIRVGPLGLEAFLSIPVDARGLVVFAHGSGSSRFSPRNQFVAAELQKAGLATLLFDLLLSAEADDRRRVFDIPLLAERVADVASWLGQYAETEDLNIGYWGSSTGAAAALVAAAQRGSPARAIVSRGGRPDLAGLYLERVTAPTLLLVGGQDHEVIKLNKKAYVQLKCLKSMKLIPGATHLFAEPGCLEQVVQLTTDWFCTYLDAGQN